LRLFAQRLKEGQQLPPTLGTLIPHLNRAYYMALLWKLSRALPTVPNTNFLLLGMGGEQTEISLLRQYAPAPEALLELRKCNCETGCIRLSCSCLKNGLTCTDMCGCGDECENVAADNRPIEIEID